MTTLNKMNDYIFTDFDVLQQPDYTSTVTKSPTRSADLNEAHMASLYSSFQTVMDQDFLKQTNFASDTGFEYFGYLDQVGILNETLKLSKPGQETPRSDFGTLKKLEHNTPTSSHELLQKLQESKLNLILVATSLDENEVIQKLESSLNPRTCRMIPLTFKDDHMSDVDVSNILGSDYANIEAENRNNENWEDSSQIAVKRKHVEGKDEKYWKHRNRNNRAAKRSREAKRARFSWMEARTKELEVENARLEEQLKTLQIKVSELEDSG